MFREYRWRRWGADKRTHIIAVRVSEAEFIGLQMVADFVHNKKRVEEGYQPLPEGQHASLGPFLVDEAVQRVRTIKEKGFKLPDVLKDAD